MFGSFQANLEQQLSGIHAAGTYKSERVIITPQGTTIRVADGQPVLNFCANNYLGLAQHPAVAAAAKAAIDEWGYGCASVRFICGTQGVHKQLEKLDTPGSRYPAGPSAIPARLSPGRTAGGSCPRVVTGRARFRGSRRHRICLRSIRLRRMAPSAKPRRDLAS